MPLTRVFTSGDGQAVRIPADLAYADRDQELTITRLGDVITIAPARGGLKDMVAILRGMPTPPDIEVYEPIEMPDRETD
jgi:antitoxin VapB